MRVTFATLVFRALLALAACTEPPVAATKDAQVEAATADVASAETAIAAPDTEASDVPAADTAQAETAQVTSYDWESLPAAAGAPIARWGFVTADLGDGRALLFGGTTFNSVGQGGVLADTWLVDVRGATPEFNALAPAKSPPPRYCGCAAWDPERKVMLAVGGRDAQVKPSATWSYDLDGNTWTEVPVPVSPPGAVGCAMAWSPDRRALFLFGGGGAGGFDDRTWRFDAKALAWVELAAKGPSPRYDSVLRHVAAGQPMVLFAGSKGASGKGNFYNDVWRFDPMAQTWTQTQVSGTTPPGRRTPWLLVEPNGAGFIMGFGVMGILPDQALDDLWRFDFAKAAWQVIDEAGDEMGPEPRGYVQALPGTKGSVGLLVGGHDLKDTLSGVWRLTPPGGSVWP